MCEDYKKPRSKRDTSDRKAYIRSLQGTLSALEDIFGTSKSKMSNITAATSPPNQEQPKPKPVPVPIPSTKRAEQRHMIPAHMIKLHSKIQAAKVTKAATPPPPLFTNIRTSPTAHLSILRNPTKCYADKESPAYSPALGNSSDAFNRLIARQYLACSRTIEANSSLYAVSIPAPKDHKGKRLQRLRANHFKAAKKARNRFQREYKDWIYERLHAERVIEEVEKETGFWLALQEDEVSEWDENGVPRAWREGKGPRKVAKMVEREMGRGREGRSLKGLERLEREVRRVEKEEREREEREKEREERMRWEAMDEVKVKDGEAEWWEKPVEEVDEIEEGEYDDEDEDCHLYDGVHPGPDSIEASEEEDDTPSLTSSVSSLEDDTSSSFSSSSSEPTPLQIAQNNLNEFKTIICIALIKAKRKYIATARANIETPIAAFAAKQEARIKAEAQQCLLITIINLRLRMAGDGLVSDASGLNYTAPASDSTTRTGPGSVSFTGRITSLITRQKLVLHRAYKISSLDEEISGYYQKKDWLAGCKISVDRFWDLWRVGKKQRGKCEDYDALYKCAREAVERKGEEKLRVVMGNLERALKDAKVWVGVGDGEE